MSRSKRGTGAAEDLHLPPGREPRVLEKRTAVATSRDLEPGEDSISPSRQPDVASRDDLRRKVEEYKLLKLEIEQLRNELDAPVKD